MKRNFILIALLSSVAFAEPQSTTTVDATLANGTDSVVSTGTNQHSSIQWDTDELNNTLDSYMLTFNFSGSTAEIRQTIFTVANGGNSWTSGLSVSASTTDSNLTLSYNGAATYTISDSHASYGTRYLAFNSADTYAFAYDGVNDVAYLMNLTAAQADGAIYGTNYILLSRDNTLSNKTGWLDQDNTLVSGTSTLWATEATMTVGSVTDMSAVAIHGQDVTSFAEAMVTASIPEPATATLSLLALAGLAARRRRK